MPSGDKIVVLTSCASARQAARIASALVEPRLAACVSVLGTPVMSTYRWKGKVETAKEFLLLVKTSRARFAAVQRAIRQLHTYDVPEIIALPISAGSRPYLAWLADSLGKSK